MRVLVCGSRDYINEGRLFAVLDTFHSIHPITQIIEGGARGADYLSKRWAMARGIPYHEVDADWNTHGKRAGPIRNQRMIDMYHPEHAVAFPLSQSRGTWDMINRCNVHNIPVEIIT